MYCYNCGKQISDNAKFCRYCGASQAIINGGGAGAGGIPAPQDGSQPGAPSSESPYGFAGQPSAVQAQAQAVLQAQADLQAQPLQQPQVAQQTQFQADPQAQPLQQSQANPQPQMPLTQPPQAAPREQYQTAQQPQSFQQPFPQSQSFSAPPSSTLLASQPCSYKVAPEADFKKFEFGGMPEGTVEIYGDRLELFSKSKMVRLAFGMIGSALSGKGKADLTISDYMVRRDTINNNMKNVFRFYLTDGRLAYIQLNGLTGQQEARNAMQRFLRM